MTGSEPSGATDALRWVSQRDDYRSVAAGLDPSTRLPVHATITVDDPWQAFRRARGGEWSAYFETLGEHGGWSAFGIDPSATLEVDPDELEPAQTTSLQRLTSVLEEESIHLTDEEPPIPGGWFGWLSYDIARELEDLPETTERDRPLPRLGFARFDTIASWQTPIEEGPVTIELTSCPRVGEDGEAAFDRGRERIAELATQIESGSVEAEWGTPGDTIDFTPGVNREEYERRVRTVKDYIREGDTFQVNLSQRFDGPATIHPVDAYEALRAANPSPYCGLLETPSVDLVSTSPELLLERTDTVAKTEPIAGTRPRGDTEAADEALAEELRTDPKERAEHAMLVDLERNDLGRVCTPGTVEVTEYRRVDRYASVWHLVSMVEGELNPEVTLAELFAAMLPGGTVTGAPKPRTMEIIDELEDRRRGPYTGSMAVIGFDGQIRSNMVIRTLEHHDRQYRLRVGGGIVHDSIPDREYDETLAKAAAIREAIATDPTGDP